MRLLSGVEAFPFSGVTVLLNCGLAAIRSCDGTARWKAGEFIRTAFGRKRSLCAECLTFSVLDIG